MAKNTKKRILAGAILLSMLTACGQAPAPAENGFAVRIVNQSAVSLYAVALSYSVNGATRGSKTSERIDKSAEQAVYEFTFLLNELPTPIDTFGFDVFAATKAGEDYSDCGGASIKNPRTGGVYTLALKGEEVASLTLYATEPDIELK